MTFRYYMIGRPPFIGTQPPGDVAREVWTPRKDIPGTTRPAYGWVEYDRRLRPDEIWQYEMWPADENENDEYLEWREAEEK